MGKVVNLNTFRKKKAKEAKRKRAEQNRRLHGRTKAERAQDLLAKQRLEQKLAGALLIRERVALDEVPSPTPPATTPGSESESERESDKP